MGIKLLQMTSTIVRKVNMSTVADHYGERGSLGYRNLFNIIVEALGKSGTPLNGITIDNLAPMDEFHIGGRDATIDFLKQLNISEGHKVLDVGCGLGGPTRFAATQYGCDIIGVDLTHEFVSCGIELTKLVGLTDKVKLLTGSALDLKSVLTNDDELFDRAFMLHVGMNIENKTLLVSEIASQLRPGGLLGIYDVMRWGENSTQDLDLPVPWTTNNDTNFAAYPGDYKKAIDLAGMKLISERNRFEFAVEFFSKVKQKKEPPILGLHLLMKDFPQKTGNMLKNLKMCRIAPIEMIAVKQ